MPLVRFDQDPTLPAGAGLFSADDGSSFFAHDPEMAAQLSPEIQSAAAPPPDERTARSSVAGADIDAINRELAGGQQAPAPPPTASDVQPSRAVPAAAPPPPPSAEMAQESAPASPALGQAEQLQQNIDAYANRPVYVAPTRGGVVPTTQTEVREASGMPYDPNGPQVMDRLAANVAVQQANLNRAHAESARAAGEAAAYQAALPEIEEKARIAQMRRDAQERQYRRDRDDLEQAIADSDKAAKSFNANRWFEDRGAIGQIGAGIAQAFGAAAATLTGGPNVVLQQINGYIDRDIANQRAQIEAGKVNADNALARLNRQFGNLDQAEAALRIAQQKKVETMAAAYAASTKSEDVQSALDVWLAENQQRHVAAEQQFQNAAYGKTSLTTAAKVIPSTSGGMRDPTEKEVQQRYDTLEKRGNVVDKTYEAEIKRRKALGEDPEKPDKQKPLVIENLDGSQVEARSAEEAREIRKLRGLQTTADRSAKELERLSSLGGRLSPTDRKAYNAHLEAVINSANTLAGQGVVRGEDVDRYKSQMLGDQYGIGAAEAAATLRDIVNTSYQARVDAQRGAAVTESFGANGAKVKYTGQASKTPTAKTQFKQVGR